MVYEDWGWNYHNNELICIAVTGMMRMNGLNKKKKYNKWWFFYSYEYSYQYYFEFSIKGGDGPSAIQPKFS